MKTVFLIILGTSYGLLAAAGVFTVLVAVGLVPRFAGKTHTAGKAILYEEMVIFGTLTGSFLSIFSRSFHFYVYESFACVYIYELCVCQACRRQ